MEVKKIITQVGSLFLALLTLMQVSCNEDFPNLLKEEYHNAEMGGSLNKVLIVVVDGVRGNALLDIEPDNLRRIARNSLYTNSALGDFNAGVFTKEIGLANIFTGVTRAKHGVSADLSTINTATYPTLFENLKANYETFRSVGLTTNQDVATYLYKGIDETEVLGSDEDVLTKTKAAIQEEEIEMVVAHLSNVAKVGEEHSYESDDVAYRDAIETFDAQMGDLIASLQQRPNYSSENWLVVITSSIGGAISYVDPDDETVFADHRRNTFTYFYSPRFLRKYQPRPSTNTLPFVGAGLHLRFGAVGNNATSARLPDVNVGNFGSSQNFTITFFVKQATEGTEHNYPPLLMKRDGTDSGTGWQFIMAGGNVQFGASAISKISSTSIMDAQWHAITVSVDRGANTAKIYTDGVLSASTAANTTDLTNSTPLTWGKKPGNSSNTGEFTVCNLQIYDVAMTDEEVLEYAALGLVKSGNSPFYNNLIGYWPAYGDNGTRVVTDVAGKAGNMTIYNEISWSSFDEYVPYFIPDINENTFRLVPNQVDVPFFVYQWFGVLPKSSWALDGQAWTPPYAILEY